MSAEAAKIIPINPEEALEQKTLSLYEKASALQICDEATYVAAGEVGKALKALEKEIIDYFDPLRISAKASYDAILKKKNDELAPVAEAMTIVRNTMNAYIREQERIRREAEEKARREEEERARKEKERLLSQAEKALDQGKDGKAENLIDRADNVYAAPVMVAPVIDKTVKTASGNITQAKELKITVTNVNQFLKALIEQHPGAVANIIKIGDGPLKAFVKANGIDKFPGLTVEQTVGVRL